MATTPELEPAKISHRSLLIILSTSFLPLLAFHKLRSINRLGVDQLHVVLFQLLFVLLLTHKLPRVLKPRSVTCQGPRKLKDDAETELLSSSTGPPTSAPGAAERLKDLLQQCADWTGVFPSPGVEVLRHQSMSSLYAVRTELEEGVVTVEQLVRCLVERKRWEWDRQCECGEDLGDGVSWVRLKAFWPIKPKELVMRSSIFRLSRPDKLHSANGQSPLRILAASTSTTHPLKQSTLEVKLAGYLIEQLPPSSTIRVTQVVDLSGFGPLPTFVTKAILTKFVPSSLRKLLALAQHITPQPSAQAGCLPAWMPPPLGAAAEPHPSSQALDEQARLRAMIEELKAAIDLLQRRQPSSISSWINTKALAGLVTVIVGFSVLKNNPGRRRQVRWLYSQT